ncbi:MAG: Sapep family Mn(2+)-dependent dipeptidase [Oscillospiraceae bacterium]|nr:Sapep family Mn(2+)-dependent dipeptidase [Oscillospiraceae bacterium]
MLSKENEKRIENWIEEHKEEFIADLSKIIAVPSVADPGVAEGEYPFGIESANVLAAAKELVEGYGFAVKNLDNFCLVANIGEGEEKIGILGHLDVVPCGNDWNYPPYQLTVDGDILVGRGVLDDKGPLWASIFAVRCLKDLGLMPKREIEFFLGGQEECGMNDLLHYVDVTEKLPDVSFTPDGNYPICHGEKGALRFYLAIPCNDEKIVDFTGGTVRNVVADKAVATLKGVCGKALSEKLASNERISVETEGEFVKVTATGASVHASTPENGINAIGVLANALLDAEIFDGEAKSAMEYLALVNSDYNGAALGVPVEDEPSGKLTHVGGVIGMDRGILNLSIDIRYPVTLDGADLLEKIIAKAEEHSVTVHDIADTKPAYSPADSDLVRTCMRVINSVFHRDHWKPYTMGGGTYAKHMPNACALGPEDPDYESPFGLFRGSIHQADEHTPARLLFDTMKVYAKLLVELDDIDVTK